jgi:Pentapeptide repeats (9 copies)
MILRHPRERPEPWKTRKQRLAAKWKWATPFIAIEWIGDWVAFLLSNWSFLEVLEYLGTFSVLIAVIFYFSESGDRIKQRHYQAWQVINTAQGNGGSGGRIEALQELNADKVPLVGVDVSSAFLQGLDLHGANLMRSDFSSADLRNSNFTAVDFTLANLNSANLRNAHLDHAKFDQADLRNGDLTGASLASADLSGASLDDSDLSHADLKNVIWQHIKSMKGANIAAVRNAPDGFVAWAMSSGAVDHPDGDK